VYVNLQEEVKPEALKTEFEAFHYNLQNKKEVDSLAKKVRNDFVAAKKAGATRTYAVVTIHD